MTLPMLIFNHDVVFHLFDSLYMCQSMHKERIRSISLIFFLAKMPVSMITLGSSRVCKHIFGFKGMSVGKNKIKETSTKFTSQYQLAKPNFNKSWFTQITSWGNHSSLWSWSGKVGRKPKNMDSSSPVTAFRRLWPPAATNPGPSNQRACEVAFSAAVSACEKGTLGRTAGCAVGGYNWHIRGGYSHKTLEVASGI